MLTSTSNCSDSRILEAIEQPVFDSSPDPPLAEEPKRKRSRARKCRRTGRTPIQEHLDLCASRVASRNSSGIPKEEKACPETGKPLKRIGEEVGEKLEYRPAKLIVSVHKRPKCASPEGMASSEAGIFTAPVPDHPVETSKAEVMSKNCCGPILPTDTFYSV